MDLGYQVSTLESEAWDKCLTCGQEFEGTGPPMFQASGLGAETKLARHVVETGHIGEHRSSVTREYRPNKTYLQRRHEES